MTPTPNFDREIAVYDFMLGYGTMLAEGIDAARFCEQPLPNLNHPAWQFGHLATVSQRLCERLEQGPPADPTMLKLFGGGSMPVADSSKYPGKDEIVGAWVEGHAKVVQAVRNVSPEVLARPNPIERMSAALPTIDHLVTMLLTSHESMHLGQLAVWRRAIGIPAMF